MASSDQATSTDAVSVLLNAAPSSVVQSFESAFDSLTSDLLGPTSQPTAAPTSQPQPTDTPFNTHPTSTPASRPTQNTTPPISSPFSRPTTFSTPTPSTFLTAAAARPTSTAPTPSATLLPSTSSSTGQLKNASVAGIATGLAAAFVLFTLAAIYLYRRHQQGKPLPFFSSSSSSGGRFSRLARSRGSKNNRDSQRAFPESAWLYDPPRTPPRTGSPPPQLPPLEHEMQEDRHFSSSTLGLGVGEGSASQMLLIPEPREGAVELGGSAPNSPPQGFSSPLLALPTATTRGGSGGRRGSGSGIGIGGGAAGAGAGAGLGISGTRAESPPSQDRRRRSGSPSSGSGSWGRRSTSQSPTPGRRSRGNSLGVGSRTDLTRPMSAIWEELPSRGGGGGGGGGGVGGGFVDDRTGLLAPISGGNLARHST
ncbi:hypothetical protein LTR91_012532 [Friedmanniomyces endolithicus]|uniref:Uncharacterized protein n=1 Tax=Friedmanniomyces endolithicus TaxID=329885 RepID=A0AAN6KF75_9PEZI|nr:hypothetical protein LTR57_005170 [Friedmanniomyces endolithicus]KAK0979626.1 hypothetical protein LTR91_012532 [Friedmanniomyces endolithicus]KAK0988807.1 hypothetical protein LTS01_009076 [Friedmanniomyces endolithicus]KAK1037699.1 hypothetical protein LTS16_012607 [Friedmanniomyces endolithicus]